MESPHETNREHENREVVEHVHSSTGTCSHQHVDMLNQLVSKTEKIGERARHELFHRFGIDHPVLQFETTECGNGGILCEISSGGTMND